MQWSTAELYRQGMDPMRGAEGWSTDRGVRGRSPGRAGRCRREARSAPSTSAFGACSAGNERVSHGHWATA